MLAYFSFLLIQITIQYIPFNKDVAFLSIKQHYIDVPFYIETFYAHVYSAIFTVFVGFTQFSKSVRKKYPKVHKYIGWSYVIIVMCLAAPSGLYIGLYANGGLSSQISFLLLSIFWFSFTLLALLKIRKKDFISHRKYMIRSYALTLSAITLRAWKYILVVLFEPKPMDIYIVVAWLGWVLNLIIAEYIIYKINKHET